MTPLVHRLSSVADGAVLAYLLAVLLAGVQLVVLDDPRRTLTAAAPYGVALLVAIVVRAVGPADEAALTRWLRTLAGLGVLLSAWILGAFVGALPGSVGEPSSFYRLKLAIVTPLGDHNTVAGLLLPTVVAAAAMAVREPRWRLGLAATVLGMVATLSRGAALVLAGTAVVGWLVSSSRRFALHLVVAAAATVVLVLALALGLDAAPPAGAPLRADGPVGASILGRVDLAARGVELGAAHPALGVGMGRFGEHAGDLPPPNDHAHQLFAHAAAEGGVVLLLVAAAVPLVLARRVWRLDAGPARDVLLLGGLGLVVHAQIEILGGRVGYEVLLAGLVGMADALHGRGDDETGAPPPGRQR